LGGCTYTSGWEAGAVAQHPARVSTALAGCLSGFIGMLPDTLVIAARGERLAARWLRDVVGPTHRTWASNAPGKDD